MLPTRMFLLKLPRAIARFLSEWRAFRAFRASYAFLGGDQKKEAQGVILLVSLTDWAPRLLWEGMIGLGLRLRGYDIVVVTYGHFWWAKKYFRVFGITRFIDFDVLQDEARKSIESGEAEKLLRENQSFGAMFALAWRGIGVGRHVLSTVVRQLKQGTPTFGDPRVTELLQRLLPTSLATVLAAEKIFADVTPRAVLFVEKGYTPYGEICDSAINRGIDVIQYCHGHRSDLLIMKRFSDKNRFRHTSSVSQKSWDIVRSLPWSAADEQQFMDELRTGYEQGTWLNRKFLLEKKRMKSPEEIRAQLALDPAKKIAVIFSHVLWDATFFFGTNLFPDYERWLIETVKAACQNDSVNWIVKLHPDYVWKMKMMGDSAAPRDVIALESDIGALPPHITVVPPDTDISTYSFFRAIDYCITVRGTVGIEAPCFGIPVFTAGTGRYDGLGFTNDSATIEEYLGKMRRIQDFPRLTPEETSLACRHAHALFSLRPLPFTTFEMVPIHIGGTFDHRTEIRVRSLDDVRKAPDLNAFADWVCQGHDEDYLHLQS